MPKTGFDALKQALYSRRYLVVLIFCLILIGNIASFSIPYFLKLITDYVVETSAPEFFLNDLIPIAVAITIIYILQEIFFRVAHYFEIVLNIRVYVEVTAYYFNNIINRPSSYFEETFSGKLSRRVEQIGTSIKYFSETFLWEFGWTLPALGVSAVLMYIAHPVLFYGFAFWLAVFIVISYPLLKGLYKRSQQVAEQGANLDGRVVDAIANVGLIHSFSAEKYESSRLGKNLQSLGNTFMSEGWWFLGNKIHQGLSVVAFGLIEIYLSLYLFDRGEITVGDFVLVAATIPTLTGVIWHLGDMVLATIRNFGNLNDAINDLQTETEVMQQGNAAISGANSMIRFRNISFTYPKAKNTILHNFNLEIEPGTRVGLVGTSGAGKSTLVKLLLRQYDPQNGEITIGETKISDTSLEELRRIIAFVPQDTTLFHRSLYENILYARPDATQAEVLIASQKAHAHEFIKELPEQYDTLVGERGVKLSGGQRQRIAIARAMLKNSPILVLDEATSALDGESEEIVQTGLKELFAGRTVIAIAHRLSTLREMDRVIVVEEGLIVEDGNPSELLQREEGIFKAMWEHQKGGFVA